MITRNVWKFEGCFFSYISSSWNAEKNWATVHFPTQPQEVWIFASFFFFFLFFWGCVGVGVGVGVGVWVGGGGIKILYWHTYSYAYFSLVIVNLSSLKNISQKKKHFKMSLWLNELVYLYHELLEINRGPISLTWFKWYLAWISNYIHCFMCDVIAHPWHNFNSIFETAVEVKLWMSNYILLFYLDVIIYTCSTPDAGLGNHCQLKEARVFIRMILEKIVYHYTLNSTNYWSKRREEHTVRCHYNGLFSHRYSQKTPHSSPVRSFVDSASDWYSASVPAIIYAISYCFGRRYSGTDCAISS